MSKISDLHDSVFTLESYKERYKLGQFITEGDHPKRIAKLVIDIFDKHQDLTIYEPCVGTGVIVCELLSQLTLKYGVATAKKIATRRLKLADIDPKMVEVCKKVLFIHTEKLFGEGIDFDITVNDLMTDSFDLSTMIVFGNYPFNAGNDYNYLAKIIQQQMKCGLSHMVLMGNTTTFDPRKIQSKKIIGDEFLSKLEIKHTTDDFQKVAVRISIIVYDKNEAIKNIKNTKLPNIGISFKKLIDFNITVRFLGRVLPSKFADGESFLKNYDTQYSIPYFRGVNLRGNTDPIRIPNIDSPVGTYEREMSNKWWKENPKGEIQPPHELPLNGAVLINKFCSKDKIFISKYLPSTYSDPRISGNRAVVMIEAPTIEELGIIGLILTNPGDRLLDEIATKEYTGYGLRPNKIKRLPIPIETPTNKLQFDRLREIGQTLIIENKTDSVLRTEADDIIEGLYNPTSTYKGGSNKFTTVKKLVNVLGQPDNFPKGVNFNDHTPLHSDQYNPQYSIAFFRVQEWKKEKEYRRVPAYDAPTGTMEHEIYTKWVQEGRWAYKYPTVLTGLLYSRYTTSSGDIRLLYVDKFKAFAGTGMVVHLRAPNQILSIIGLILKSGYFKHTLIKMFPKWQKNQYAIGITPLKTMPIPIETPANKIQFDRLYEIGQILIIENKTDDKLRTEADDIIEGLYNPPNSKRGG